MNSGKIELYKHLGKNFKYKLIFMYILFCSHDDFKVTSDTVKAVLSPDCAYACAGGNDGSLYIWNTTNGKIEKVLNKEHS